jgi:hypothetical protein
VKFAKGRPEDPQAGELAETQETLQDLRPSRAPRASTTGEPIRCDEALRLWEDALAGRAGDPARTEEALRHMAQCQERCAEVLATSEVDTIEQMAKASRRGDVYEALGLSYEEEGDAHHRRYKRLRKSGRASPEEVERERALALENWKTATENYESGTRFFKSLFLVDALKRMKRKPALLPPLERPVASPALEELVYLRQIVGFIPRSGANYYKSTLTAVLPAAAQGAGAPQIVRSSAGWAALAPGALPSFFPKPTAGADLPDQLQEWRESRRDLLRVEGVVGPFALALAAAQDEDDEWHLRVLVQPRLPDDQKLLIVLNLRKAGPLAHSYPVVARHFFKHGVWSAPFQRIAGGSYYLAVAARQDSGEWVAADLELALALSLPNT